MRPIKVHRKSLGDTVKTAKTAKTKRRPTDPNNQLQGYVLRGEDGLITSKSGWLMTRLGASEEDMKQTKEGKKVECAGGKMEWVKNNGT